MIFRPAESSKNIVEFYKDYILTTFRTNNEEYNEQLKNQLEQENVLSKGPYISLSDSFEKGESIKDLVEKGILCKEINKFEELKPNRNLYKHQAEAIKKSKANNLIITTGTGSGKTECFLIPVINQLLEEYENNTLDPGVRTLIIYPMNALVNDQIRRLREIFSDYKGNAKITYGKFTGETKEKYTEAERDFINLEGTMPIENELISREQIRENPPNILITNYAMLEYLLLRPGDSIFFSHQNAHKWKNIVFDEAHMYYGAKGIEVANLVKRIKAMINRKDIKFILTSATLGDENSNKEIINFSEALCSTKFTEDSIIRASRVAPIIEGEKINIDFNIYKKLANLIRNNESTEKILDFLKDNNFKITDEVNIEQRLSHTLYYMISKDEFYIKVRKSLLNNSKPLNVVCKELNVNENDFTDFITVASKANYKGDKIFDAKYHMFIRGIDGIFVTLGPSNKLFIKKLEQYKENPFDKSDLGYKVYQVSFCSNCKSVYIVGQEENGYLVQKSINDDNYDPEIYLFQGDYSEDSEDIEQKTYVVCSICGAIQRKSSLKTLDCGHSSENYNYLIKVKDKGSELHKCPCCHSVNNKTSIVKPRYLGNEAATAVIATGLYKELPKSIVKKEKKLLEDDFFGFGGEIEEEKEEQLVKQFLVFSDSRQDAAFFASYLQSTYNDNIVKRLMTKVSEENHEIMKKGVPLDYFVEQLKELFIEYKIYPEEYCEREAWIFVIKELINCKSKRSLQGKGILYFDYDFNFGANKTLQLDKDEVNTLFKIFANEFIEIGAVKLPINLKKSEKQRIFFNGIQKEFELSHNSDKNKVFWLPSKNQENKRIKILKKYFPEQEDYIKLLKSIYDALKANKKISENKIDSNCIKIKSVDKLYICDECKTITPFNLKNICPNHRCSGTLKELNFKEEYKNDHYYKNYRNLDIYGMTVKEHTAQLSSSKAYDYQNKFKNKEINVLSCSTTFEMGVDLGSLETVFMRNIPPSPANYAQRAGRAGRSINSEAYALTFCPNKSHDMNYFRHPESIIEGVINPPNFNVDNDKIVLRHIFASAFSFFFKEKAGTYRKTIGEFLDNGFDLEFKRYLESKPIKLKNYLKDILSQDLQYEFGIENFSWIKYLFNTNEESPGYFTIALEKYWSEFNELKKENDRLNKERDTFEIGSNKIIELDETLKSINKSIKTLKDQQLISFLSSNNLIPKYGFPIDTVELKSFYKGGINNQLRLNRDLFNAISEYAPESEIVADGKIIKSRYVRTLEGYSWPKYNYIICPQCETLNKSSWVSGKIEHCRQCGFDFSNEKQRQYIIPKFGFLMDNDNFKEVGTEKPTRTFKGKISYLGDETKMDFKKFLICGKEVLIGSSKMDKLAVLNTSEFYICEKCGYGVIDHKSGRNSIKKKHEDPNGYICSNNELKQYSLGHEFKTDVVYIKFVTENDIIGQNRIEAWTILYSLLEGLSMYLSIDRTELSGCLHGCGDNLGFVLFDNTPGGAGYVKQLKNIDNFIGMLEKSYKVVSECDCGGEEGDTVCYGCLCNYYNQNLHHLMKRKYAINFFNSLKNGESEWKFEECKEVDINI